MMERTGDPLTLLTKGRCTMFPKIFFGLKVTIKANTLLERI